MRTGQLLLRRDRRYWRVAILRGLERVQAEFENVFPESRMGYAIARPKVGAIFSPERRRLRLI